MHSDGLRLRDFTYVDNVVHALLKASEAPDVSGQVFNIVMGRGVTVLELVAVFNRLLGKSLTPLHAPPRPGDVRYH